MRLVIIDDDGEIHEVLEDIEDYDLEKSIARAEVVNAVQEVLEEIMEEE